MVKAKKFILKQHFVGDAREDDLQLVEEELPPVKDGEVLIKATCWSVDPYMRSFAISYDLGTTMFGSQVGKIIESKADNFPEGKYIIGYFGWRTHTVADPTKAPLKHFPKPYLLPDFKGQPTSLALGVLGMPGNAAYFGFTEICEAQPGEMVVVTSAGGCVGSTVGQIAKIKGCRVLGFTCTDEKVKWLKEELGFDFAYNYKTNGIAKPLLEGAPDGVDIYFDNVGGDAANIVIKHMRKNGRVAVCGSIALYNNPIRPQSPIMPRSVRRENFSVHQWLDRWMEGINQNLQWILEGKLKYRETITKGFENMPRAFIGMLNGENTGKALVKP